MALSPLKDTHLSPIRPWITLLATMAAVITADQASKRFLASRLAQGAVMEPIPALGAFFQLTHQRNSGAAFGILPDANLLFLGVAVVVVGALLLFYRRVPEQAVAMQVALGLIGGGALGNAVDRIQYGAVVDFILYRIPSFTANVSNLADHAVLIGVALLMMSSERAKRTQRPAAGQPHPGHTVDRLPLSERMDP